MRQHHRVPRSSRNEVNVARLIGAWFKKNARDLPWRRTRDPYGIWISEVMLQQTQVKTVIPYWERWMNLFPDAVALARAPEEQVLKAWEGLGYYTRARNLQRAAHQIVREHSGIFPTHFGQVLDLPGVGRYTAGAVCSIAFGDPTPILDGNVARVLSRVYMVSGSPKATAARKELWDLSHKLVRATEDCSDLNQGLMELGATVCVPKAPLCGQCPLKKLCRAFLQGKVASYPEPPKTPRMGEREFVALLITSDQQVLVRKRAANVVNGGMWEFPNYELAVSELFSRLPRNFKLRLEPLKVIKHTITRNRITLRAFAGRAEGFEEELAKHFDAQWQPISFLATLPFSSAHAKLRTTLENDAA